MHEAGKTIIRWMVQLVFVNLLIHGSVLAQNGTFSLMQETGIASWPEDVAQPDARRPIWQSQLLSHYQHDGYFLARLDSINWDEKVVYLVKGPVSRLANVWLEGDKGQSALWRPGADSTMPITKAFLADLIRELLEQQSKAGFLGARASIARFAASDAGVDVFVQLTRGPEVRIHGLQLEGDPKTTSEFSMLLAGINSRSSAVHLDLESVRKRVQFHGLHRFVGQPRFELLTDTTAIVIVPVEPIASGAFDLSAGYLPGSEGGKAQLVGSGHLNLINAFGRGRQFGVEVDRFPGQASGIEFNFKDPFVRNSPVSIQIDISGYQQDSTYRQSKMVAGVGFRPRKSTEVTLQYAWESSTPLQGGSLILDGEQRIADSNGRYLGVETTFKRLDHALYPRSGVSFSALVETGERTGKRSVIVGTDTTRLSTRVQQERLSLAVRGYLSFLNRWTFMTGVDGRITRSDETDESEWYRLGGAESLRGYDENQFRGTSVGRLLTEIRGYIDQTTFGYVFFDLGVVEAPGTQRTTHPGYGLGFSFESAMGPISISYALNTEERGRNGRIHLGLSFGL